MMQHRLHGRDCGVAICNWGWRCALTAAVLMLPLAAAGCRGLGRKGPVSEDVAQARQLSQQGLNAMQRGDWASAESSLGEAVKACPVDVEARRHYAETMWRRGQHDVALEHLLQAINCTPNDATLTVRAGQMQLELGKLEEAHALADQSLDLNPQSADAWALRGRVEMAEGRHDRALADLHRALEFASKDRQLLYQTAEVYRQLNRPQRALSTLISLRETYAPGEEHQQVYYLEGLSLQALGRPADAAVAFSLALDRGQPSPELFYRLAESHVAAGRQADAYRAAEQALALDANHVPSQLLRQQVEVASRPLETMVP
jgi:tetratricopeptide (TPR) repeat protein